MPHDEFIVTGRKLPISEATRRLNPELFGPGAAVGRLEASKSKQAKPQALDGAGAQQQGSQGGVGEDRYRVALTLYVKKEMDSQDNVQAACKPLCDAIAQSLHGGTPGQYDNLVLWEYGQQQTKGREGVAVRVELVLKDN